MAFFGEFFVNGNSITQQSSIKYKQKIPMLRIVTLLLLTLLALRSECQKISEVLKTHQSRIFQNFKLKYSKRYKDESQQLYRNLIVFNNANKIATHNSNSSNRYTLAVNGFADLSEEEFRARYTGYTPADENLRNIVQLEKEKEELGKRECACDRVRIEELRYIENDGNISKQFAGYNAEIRRRKRSVDVENIQQKINQFEWVIPTLSGDQYQVTANKIRESFQYKDSLATIVKSDPASSSNLKKEETKITYGLSFPTNIITKISTNAYVKLQPTTLTDSFTAPPADSAETKVLNSLGDKQLITQKSIPSPIFSIPTANSLLKQTLSSSILTSTTVSTFSSSTLSTATLPSPTSTNTTTNTTTNRTTNTTTSTSQNVDWSNYTGPVRYQGLCGSCYALVAVGNLEALLAIYSFGFALPMSVQQVLDCANNGLTFGCDGGYLEGAFQFLKENGVSSELIYPYTSGETGRTGICKLQSGPFKISSWRNIPSGDCFTLKKQLARKPISVAIASFNLQFYQSGTFTNCNDEVDHAVLLVGFNAQRGWKIKNTWGTSWGEAGYAWIQDGNNCGICSGPTVASIAGEPLY